MDLCVIANQSLTVPSLPEVSTIVPSGLKTASVIDPP